MKVWIYFMVIIGIGLMFQMAGINIGIGSLLNLLGVGFDATSGITSFSSSFWLNMAGGIFGAVIAVGVIIAGLFSRSVPENYVILPFITGTGLVGGAFLFGSEFVALVTYAGISPWLRNIVGFFMIALGVGFYLALLEFFRGSD